MVTSTGSTREGQEWISPNCVLREMDGIVYIPVLNLGKTPCNWSRMRGLWKANPVTEEQLRTINPDTMISNISTFQHGGGPTPMPEFINDLRLDERLTTEQRKELRTLLSRHAPCFAKKKGLTHLAEHCIETGDARPIRSAPYRVSETERRIIKEQVRQMEEDGIVSPSRSPWSSPVVLVKRRVEIYAFALIIVGLTP